MLFVIIHYFACHCHMKRIPIFELIILWDFLHHFCHFIQSNISFLIFLHLGPYMFSAKLFEILRYSTYCFRYMFILKLIKNWLTLIHCIYLLLFTFTLYFMFITVGHIIKKRHIMEISH